jgi:hypothetical protein
MGETRVKQIAAHLSEFCTRKSPLLPRHRKARGERNRAALSAHFHVEAERESDTGERVGHEVAEVERYKGHMPHGRLLWFLEQASIVARAGAPSRDISAT